jgi:hypothetical protein
MSGNNKYAQLYNPSDAAISLDEYTWVSCGNGCGDGDGTFEYVWSFPVGATIPVGGTWTWCNSQMEAETMCTDAGADPATCCDLAEPYPVASWNGDDAQGLIKGAFADKDAATAAYAACPALLVDQIGSFSEADPGSFWPICGSTSGMDTRNVRMYRMADTCVGSGSSDAEFLDDFSGECSWGEDEGHVETGVTAWPPAPAPPAVDCIEDTAATSACTACGQELYTLTTDAAYGGTACMGSSTLCADGDGTAVCPPAPCPAPSIGNRE